MDYRLSQKVDRCLVSVVMTIPAARISPIGQLVLDQAAFSGASSAFPLSFRGSFKSYLSTLAISHTSLHGSSQNHRPTPGASMRMQKSRNLSVKRRKRVGAGDIVAYYSYKTCVCCRLCNRAILDWTERGRRFDYFCVPTPLNSETTHREQGDTLLSSFQASNKTLVCPPCQQGIASTKHQAYSKTEGEYLLGEATHCTRTVMVHDSKALL